MKPTRKKTDFFEVLEYLCMYVGFLCIISLILINIFR